MNTNLDSLFPTAALLNCAQTAALLLIATAMALLAAWVGAAGFAGRRA